MSGGTPDQETLLRDVLQGIPRSQITRVEFGSPPEDFEPQDATWLDIDVTASTAAENVRGFWQGLLVAGVFRDESARLDLPFVAGKTITVLGPDGGVRDQASSLIDQPLEHSIGSLPEAQLRKSFESAAAKARVVPGELAFVHLRGRLGMEVIVKTSDPREFVKDRPLKLGQLLGAFLYSNPPQVEGVFLEVRDSDGKLVTVSAYAARAGEGVGYTDPSLRVPMTTASFG